MLGFHSLVLLLGEVEPDCVHGVETLDDGIDITGSAEVGQTGR